MNEPPGPRLRVALSGLAVAEYFRDEEQRDVLLARARTLVGGCPCTFGCPACVGPGEATVTLDGEELGRKQVTLELLRLVHQAH
jgi:hypothetical protein